MQAIIADDEPTTRRMVTRWLEQSNFTVEAFSDGLAASEALLAAPGPVLAVLDWVMPLREGPEICRMVRRERPLANIYLLLLTGRDRGPDVVEGLEAGADDYLVKPVDSDELCARVNVGVRVLTLQERLAHRADELQRALDSVKQLRGLVPICAYCKRIRGDDNYWQQVEAYVAAHSEAQFSHGICPPCYKELMDDLDRQASERVQRA